MCLGLGQGALAYDNNKDVERFALCWFDIPSPKTKSNLLKFERSMNYMNFVSLAGWVLSNDVTTRLTGRWVLWTRSCSS
ncbi:unnamed protein product [Aspergillus oryzae]|uniref:Unnamed protein product n=2 Tax=Aspergillus oryzae TaxID=5062 RepID=A0AAN4YTA7_ASPOZ|nr:unnamed protein product [Aspergillus oryzae]GMF95113.1 unnamed protein product [Aspergillus oryzae]GMG13506.1 unnamed protein product [Aspergillus oryzae]GMG36156.1 unnamed protein product [Aspergillus oryzae]GMG46084.1 unnamed protein product [Aspergillus oryzae var. brunneus]